MLGHSAGTPLGHCSRFAQQLKRWDFDQIVNPCTRTEQIRGGHYQALSQVSKIPGRIKKEKWLGGDWDTAQMVKTGTSFTGLRQVEEGTCRKGTNIGRSRRFGRLNCSSSRQIHRITRGGTRNFETPYVNMQSTTLFVLGKDEGGVRSCEECPLPNQVVDGQKTTPARGDKEPRHVVA